MSNNTLKKSSQGGCILPNFHYEFYFASVITPFIKAHKDPYFFKTEKFLTKKLLLKKSYLMLLWLHHLTCIKNKTISVKVSLLPSRTHMETLVKAPMAHKTNSKEQILHKTHFFKVSFCIKKASRLRPSLLQAGRSLSLLSTQLFPVFETNLLFLRSYTFTAPFYIENFFVLK